MSYDHSYFGAVVFLDVLGTTDVWKNRNIVDYFNAWKKFDNKLESFLPINEIYKIWFSKFSESYNINLQVFTPQFEFNSFSDTVIITNSIKLEKSNIGNVSFFSVILVLMTCLKLIPVFMHGLHNRLFFNGTMSLGYFYRFNSSGYHIIGPAIDEAAQMYEIYDWVGVATCPSLSLTINQDPIFNMPFYKEKISSLLSLNYIPQKNGGYDHTYALLWPLYDNNSFLNIDAENHKKYLVENLNYHNYQQKPTKYNIYKKYKNTIDFYNAIISNQQLKQISLS